MSHVRTKKETEPGQVGSKLLTRADLQPAVSALKWVANTTFHSSEPGAARAQYTPCTVARNHFNRDNYSPGAGVAFEAIVNPFIAG